MSTLLSALLEIGAPASGALARLLAQLQSAANVPSPAMELVYPLAAADVAAATLPHTFTIGLIPQKMLVLGYILNVEFTWPAPTTGITVESITPGGVIPLASPFPFGPALNGQLISTQGSVFVKANKNAQVNIRLSGDPAVDSSLTKLTLYGFPLA